MLYDPSILDSPFLKYSFWMLVLPAASFVLNGLWVGRTNRRLAGWISCVFALINFAWALGLVLAYRDLTASGHDAHATPLIIPWQFNWMTFFGTLDAPFGFYLDPISVMMLLVVSAISLLVQFYSLGYMRDDASSGRFFPLLSLFTFSMLGLVASMSLIQMFVFWELVGVSSYLLISFWYEKPSAVAAGKKAFIITRFADSFFLLGIVLVGNLTGSFRFDVLNSSAAAGLLNQPVLLGLFSVNALTAGTILIFAGGWGKSAMFPLHVWLPDAMEGPTPVSSIIHSATMVVAGVFLTARMMPLFFQAAGTLALIAFLGAFTALFAAVIACTQHDIKRILAFSTLSQLGYMMFSLGVVKAVHGDEINMLGYTASMFHVFTHAFFKCMLFLAAGAAIHAVHSNLIDRMGGLRKQMPWTYASVLVACLAIAGIFPFAGFFSKDEILLAAYLGGHHVIFGIGLITGGLTAFYMFRFFFLIFHGTPRGHRDGHLHEDPLMTIPIVLLAIPSAVAGWAGKDIFAAHVVLTDAGHGHAAPHPGWLPWLAGLVGVIGIMTAWRFYASRNADVAGVLRTEGRPRWYRIIQDKFYIDELWLYFAQTLVFRFVAAPCRWFDRSVVDGAMNLTARLTQGSGRLFRLLHNGQLAFYLGIYLLGVLVFSYFTYAGY